ncbi:hypothetical protein BS47DRAFT_1482096 [Hydnum rufescens UP504]|uniref:CID domain-containing protein n=1 Tax=Hydnum rufescens UP504 TaxID=1448309 RepID=A0A9P6B8J4_9AGAM|nr:hypothetical protein BS47DRAFT_1482096 [Hydnum rufescens UP504]
MSFIKPDSPSHRTRSLAMDPFEVRMQFLTLLRRLNATQLSIQKIVGYALKYFSRCGDDLWECIVEECQKGSLNMRINILYLLDNLCESSLMHQSQPGQANGSHGHSDSYVFNLLSARQILESWRSKRILDATVVDDVVQTLDHRRETLHLIASSSDHVAQRHSSEFSKDEVIKRFEEDRERHKLLRQKRWHVPVPTQAHSLSLSNASQLVLPRLSSALSLPPPPPATIGSSPSSVEDPPRPPSPHDSALDIEFDNAWETTSDWNEDDDEAAIEENILCFGRLTDEDSRPKSDGILSQLEPMQVDGDRLPLSSPSPASSNARPSEPPIPPPPPPPPSHIPPPPQLQSESQAQPESQSQAQLRTTRQPSQPQPPLHPPPPPQLHPAHPQNALHQPPYMYPHTPHLTENGHGGVAMYPSTNAPIHQAIYNPPYHGTGYPQPLPLMPPMAGYTYPYPGTYGVNGYPGAVPGVMNGMVHHPQQHLQRHPGPPYQQHLPLHPHPNPYQQQPRPGARPGDRMDLS